MRLTSKMCTEVRKAARKASCGAPIKVELASRYGKDRPLPNDRRTMINFVDFDDDGMNTTDLFDTRMFGPQTIEDGVQYPNCAILECWTYDREELLDTVYVGLVNGLAVSASARFEKVKQAVVDAVTRG